MSAFDTHPSFDIFATDPGLDADIKALGTRIKQAAARADLDLCGFAVAWALSDGASLMTGSALSLDPADTEVIEALCDMITGAEGTIESEDTPHSAPLRMI